MKKLMALVVVGLMATAANAGTLSLEFADGSNYVEMAPSDYVTLQWVLTPAPADISQSIDNALFNLTYEGLLEHLVVEGWSGPNGWEPIGVPSDTGLFLEDYSNYGMAGDVTGFPIHIDSTDPIVLVDIVLHCASPEIGDVILTNVEDALYPAFGLGLSTWMNWTYGGDPPPGWYVYGNTSVTIHNIPEPGSLALLAMGGLALLRRR